MIAEELKEAVRANGDDVFRTLADLRRARHEIMEAVRRRRPAKPEARLLSKRAAARRLGVDRGTTLQTLIDRGELRTVSVAGRVRIPASEIERFEEGPTE